jgi:hypothetical protein
MTTEQTIQDVAMIARNGIDRVIELERENKRLAEALANANEQAERFEREWYLRGDEIERLQEVSEEAADKLEADAQEIERLKDEVYRLGKVAAAKTIDKDCMKAERDALRSDLKLALESEAVYKQLCEEAKPFVEANTELRKKLAEREVDLLDLVEQFRTKLDEATDAREQQPVAYRAWFDKDNGARWLFTLWPKEERLDVDWEPLFTAPKATIPG